MRISESCAACLYDRQREKTDNEEYLKTVRDLLDHRRETDTSPYMVYLFNQAYERIFGAPADYRPLKRKYNDLVLSMEADLRREIARDADPLARAFVMARIGNYIDFGAMNHVDPDEFLSLFRDADMSDHDRVVYQSFLKACEAGKHFLLLCDNCGEIVLDRLMLEQLRARFGHLSIGAMVRGADVLNDATEEDARYTGLDQVADILSNGHPVAGTIYDMLPEDAKTAVNRADIILAKGQGNYESFSGQGFHAFYAFLCKCDLFTSRFSVPRLTGMFVEET